MDGSPHLIIGYLLREIFEYMRRRVWCPSYEFGGLQCEELTMHVCRMFRVALETFIRVGKRSR